MYQICSWVWYFSVFSNICKDFISWLMTRTTSGLHLEKVSCFYVIGLGFFWETLWIPYLHELQNDSSRGSELAWLKEQRIWNSVTFHFRFWLEGFQSWWRHFAFFIFFILNAQCSSFHNGLPGPPCMFSLWLHEHFIMHAYYAWFSALISSYHASKIMSVTTFLLHVILPHALSELPKLM